VPAGIGLGTTTGSRMGMTFARAVEREVPVSPVVSPCGAVPLCPKVPLFQMIPSISKPFFRMLMAAF
jgi:hypothetical protein